MMGNWERVVSAATGRWVSVIGDDDYLDPELAALILNIERKDGKADALAWTGLNYIWPTKGSPVRQVSASLSTRMFKFDKAALMRKAFQWEGAAMVPLCGFSIYHGAHSRRLLDKIRKLGRGRYFEFPVIDYENAFKAILLGDNFYHSSRPFSVLGVCPLSNSSAAGSLKAQDRVQAEFNRELGWNLDEDPLLADTPFRPSQGITGCVFAVQHWLSKKYQMPHDGYELNFIRAMEANCRLYPDRESFEITAERYRAAIALWQGGKYLAEFQPVYRERETSAPRQEMYVGVTDKDELYFPDAIAGVTTPAALFRVVEAALARPADLGMAG
jgi:hypothetical protein